MENEKQLENKNLIEKELVTNPDLKDNLEKFIESKTNLEQVDMEEIKKAIMATTQEINKNNVLIAEKLTEQIEFIFKKTQIPTENTSTDNNLTSKEQNNDIAENNIENLNASLNDNLKISETESEQESLIEDNNEISFIDNKNEKRKKKSIKSYISKHSTPQKENIVITDNQTSKLIIDESDEIIENKISQQTENIAEQVDNTINEPIGGVYGLEDEKPLTGSFTFKEQLEYIEQKDVQALDIPLNGSFGIEPADESINEPVIESVQQENETIIETTEEATEVFESTETNTEPVITKTISEESESVNITEPTVEIDNSNKQETSESIQITEEISEYPAIQTVEQSNIETSLPKQEEEKEDEESGLKSLLNEMQSTIYNISAPSEPSIFENLQSANDEKFDLQRITEAILKAAESSGNNDNLSSEKFAEQVRNILEDNNK